MMARARVWRLSMVLLSLALLGGCGAPSVAPKATKPAVARHVAHSSKTRSKTSSTLGASSTPAPGGASQGTSNGGGGSASSGATLTYSMAPPGQTTGGAMAMLSVSGLPQGWQLQYLQAWSSAGEITAESPSEAMTSGFGPAQGGFSMGSDGEVISYFFPYPPGKWAGTTVHFTFVYATPTSSSQSVSSQAFLFPQE